MERDIKAGKRYRHFKGNNYIVLDVVNDADTPYGEKLKKVVIYEALYGEGLKWARKYEDFAGEVDHKKYPDVKQKYRFEEIIDE